MELINHGWDNQYEDIFKSNYAKGYSPARVIREEKGLYYIHCEHGDITAEVSGSMRYRAKVICDFPSVGDWVAIKLVNDNLHAIIYEILPRRSALKRKAPVSGGRKVRDINGGKVVLGGSTEEQIIASNIDVIFFVMSLDNNYNLRRLERYLTLGWNSGATPVIILNKADLCLNLAEKISEIEKISMGVDIHIISALKNEGIDKLYKYISIGKTVGLFGSSGVGKSTIVNCLLGETKLLTGEVREKDSKGRHTTTWRELIVLPSGGLLIDTPGMREFQVWLDQDELGDRFQFIKELEAQCKFSDCSHRQEPGCAIRKALEAGILSIGQYDNYLKMSFEVGYLEHRRSEKEKAFTKREILMSKMKRNP